MAWLADHWNESADGKTNRFGPYGPEYRVGDILRQLPDGDYSVEVTSVATAEVTELRWSLMQDDPRT